MSNTQFKSWLANLPKAELHLHIDGSLQAERMLSLAEKNRVKLPYSDADEIAAAYNFVDLQSFLNLYYLGASVLRSEDDFYYLMMDYLIKCREQKILHTEIMVEPQTYFPYGVSMDTVMTGFSKAIDEARRDWGQSVLLILSFLRHLSESEALDTLALAEPYREHFSAIGLASSESGNPPEKFTALYREAARRGYRAIAHAGEEGPPEYIWNSLKILGVNRIDHGVRCTEDSALVDYLKREAVPLTVCPLSNIRLCVFERMADHNVLEMLDKGLKVTINSDDPTYFGGFLNENYFALSEHLQLTQDQAVILARNSFEASFLSTADKQNYMTIIDEYTNAQSGC